MKRRHLFSHSVIGFFAFVLILSGSQTANAQGALSGLPKITDLKAISYQKTNALNISPLSYQELASTIRLAKAYTRGNQALAGYHEPVLTRGATGVAVFRNV